MSVAPLISRRGGLVTLVVGLLLTFGIIGGLGGTAPPVGADSAPASSESARARDALEALPDRDTGSVLLVVTREDGQPLTGTDLEALTRLGTAMPAAHGQQASPAIPAADGLAAVVQVPVAVSDDNSVNAHTVTAVRDAVDSFRHHGLQVLVTGGPAFGADLAKAFDGADTTLLLTTIGIVALLLLLTYRSPVLGLVPLVVVGLADQVAGVVTASLGARLDLPFDAGIVSVLVFGAGANYALLLISRYREELRRAEDHRVALATAWRVTMPAIVASNLTVVLALGALVLASIPRTRGLGVASALGLLVALIWVLTLLPAVLAVCGRSVFWPLVPSPQGDPGTKANFFGRVAEAVMRRPGKAVAGSLVLLAVLGAGLAGTSVGLDQTERFRTPTESAQGLEVLAAHFPAGTAQPLTVVTDGGHVPAVQSALAQIEGVTSARPGAAAGAGPTQVATVTVVTDAVPGTERARELVRAVRAAANEVDGAAALVGGQQATDLDAREGNEDDLMLVVPLVLVAVGLVLLALLRSLVAAVTLVLVNALSALATIGAGSWVGRQLLGWPALDLQVPLIAFLFLVALGIDYTIFLVHRASAEAREHGTREGMVLAVASTGAVITSGGIVLAAVFTALGVLPLVTLGQIGLIVGLGVVLDTILVRTVLVPALFGLLGDRIWWPRHLR